MRPAVLAWALAATLRPVCAEAQDHRALAATAPPPITDAAAPAHRGARRTGAPAGLDAYRSGTIAQPSSAVDAYEKDIRSFADARPPRAAEALDAAERARARDVAQADRERRAGEPRPAGHERDNLLMPGLEPRAEGRQPALLDTSAVQAALRPDEIAVSFYLAEPNSFRWVMSQEHLVLDQIAGRAAIEAQVTRLRDLLRAPTSRGQVQAAAAALGATLFDKISTADERPLIVVPHGALHYVPFEVLHLQGKMLIERHAVSYAPSLNALVHLRRAPLNAAPFRVLAVGNPAVSPAVPASKGGDRERLARLGALPFAEQELFAIARTFRDRTRILTGAAARESALRDGGLAQYAVLHVAARGLIDDAQPARSGVLLAIEAQGDGVLRIDEIDDLDLEANLVVLSASEAATARDVTGEGLMRLSRAFFGAGARSVIFTLWNRQDRFAAEFAERLYAELNEGRAAEEALRRAKQTYLDDPRYGHPHYWSSPVLLGDGTQPVVPHPVSRPTALVGLAVLLSAVALVVGAAKARKSAQDR